MHHCTKHIYTKVTLFPVLCCFLAKSEKYVGYTKYGGYKGPVTP